MRTLKTLAAFGICWFGLVPTDLFAQMTWSSVPEPVEWQARFQHAPVVFNHQMWLIGGESNGVALNDIWKSGNGTDWTQACAGAGWSARSCFPAVGYKDRIWIFGGSRADGKNLNDVWYSSDGVTWIQATAAAPWTTRHYHTALVYDDKMWIIGGYSGIRHNDVWYSSDGNNWVEATPSAPWEKRCAHSSIVFKNKMWIIGGVDKVDGKFVYLNDVWNSTDGKNWVQVTSEAPWAKRYAPQVVVYHDKIWVMGGCTLFPSTHLNDVWYSEDGQNWTPATNSADWAPRKSFAAIDFKNKIWLFGGDTTAYKHGTNDIWYSKGLTADKKR